MKLPADNEHEPELVAIDCEGGGAAATLGHFSNQFYLFILEEGSAAQATRPLGNSPLWGTLISSSYCALNGPGASRP